MKKENNKNINKNSQENYISKLLKKLFGNKKNRIRTIIIIALIIIFTILILLIRGTQAKFALNEIYEIYPEEVRNLYANIVDTSCNGDLHFDIPADAGGVELTNLNRKNLLDYMFSHMEKGDLLSDSIDDKTIKNMENVLFYGELDLLNDIDSYNYKGYVYSHDAAHNKVIRTAGECQNNITHISHLYGYFYDENQLSIDVDVAYLKDGKLYTFDDELLGEYDGQDVTKLPALMETASYYRLNYVKNNNMLKLTSIEWKHKS